MRNQVPKNSRCTGGAFKVYDCNDYGGDCLNSHDRHDANYNDHNHNDNPVCGDLDDANHDNTYHENDKLDD